MGYHQLVIVLVVVDLISCCLCPKFSEIYILSSVRNICSCCCATVEQLPEPFCHGRKLELPCSSVLHTSALLRPQPAIQEQQTKIRGELGTYMTLIDVQIKGIARGHRRGGQDLVVGIHPSSLRVFPYCFLCNASRGLRKRG